MLNDQKPGINGQMIAALILVAGFYFAWQAYLNAKYKMDPATAKVVTQQAPPIDGGGGEATPNLAAPSDKAGTPAAIKGPEQQHLAVEEKLYPFSNGQISFQLSNYGMGLKDLVIEGFLDRKGEPIRFGDKMPTGLYSLVRVSDLSPYVFDISEIEGGWTGTAQVGQASVSRTLVYNPEKRSFENTITITQPDAEMARGIALVIGDQIVKAESSSFLFPSYDHQDYFVEFAGQDKSINFSNANEDHQETFKNGSLLGLGSQYFVASILDRSGLAPDFTINTSVSRKQALAYAVYRPEEQIREMTFEQTLYVGPKEINTLKSVDPTLANVMSFGYFGFIARPLLYIMKWFQGFVGNWGVAILLLTLVVRLVVLPVNILSFRSMKNMQRVQPLINELRAKYKDDPMTQQKQMMALMKEHKANPFGGCLLMFLQIPIFFALYRVIASSVELYQSPFAGWIHDLSLHDPYFVLPLVMGVLMFIQQKLTPTAMDPAQAKILAFMPLIFTVFMLYLPSGLALYMLVSTLFGIGQQMFFLRGNSPAKA